MYLDSLFPDPLHYRRWALAGLPPAAATSWRSAARGLRLQRDPPCRHIRSRKVSLVSAEPFLLKDPTCRTPILIWASSVLCHVSSAWHVIENPGFCLSTSVWTSQMTLSQERCLGRTSSPLFHDELPPIPVFTNVVTRPYQQTATNLTPWHCQMPLVADVSITRPRSLHLFPPRFQKTHHHPFVHAAVHCNRVSVMSTKTC